MNHAVIALTDRYEQERQTVVRHCRIEMSSGCAHFELSDASGLPAGVVLPALRLKTITVAEEIDFCYDARELLGKDAEAGEHEMSKLSVRAVIRVETDTETIGWSAVDNLKHDGLHSNCFASAAFAVAEWHLRHAFRIGLEPFAS
jgi:hypothetical protein